MGPHLRSLQAIDGDDDGDDDDDDDDDEVEEDEVLKECLPPGPALFADEPLAAVLNMVRLGRGIVTITNYPNI